MNDTDKHELENFSLGIGGPLYQLLNKKGLLKNPLLFYKRRIIVVALVTWLPLLILSLFDGHALSGVTLPFIYDIDVHVRFLIVISMLLYAEIIAHKFLRVTVEQFIKCNIIVSECREKFNAIIKSILQLRDSFLVEIILFVLVYTLGRWISKSYMPLNITSWFVVKQNNVAQLTSAGYWYVFISLPIFQFILLRWYFRIVVWYRFLWQISRLPLKLNSLHPDKAGGLGFLINSIYAFGVFLLAHTVLLSGMILNRIWNADAIISNFKIEISGILIFLLILPLLPLLFFMFQMLKEKRIGTLNYSVVANQYVNDFRKKWISTKTEDPSLLLGNPDIQSLADLYNSFEVTKKMRIVPFDKSSIILLIFFIALPLFPLLLTMIPLEKIISQMVGLIF